MKEEDYDDFEDNQPLESCPQCGRSYANPGQSAWLVHPKHGEFNRINFDL